MVLFALEEIRPRARINDSGIHTGVTVVGLENVAHSPISVPGGAQRIDVDEGFLSTVDTANLAVWNLNSTNWSANVATPALTPPAVITGTYQETTHQADGYEDQIGWGPTGQIPSGLDLYGWEFNPSLYPNDHTLPESSTLPIDYTLPQPGPLRTPTSTWTIQVADYSGSSGFGMLIDGFQNQTRLGQISDNGTTYGLGGQLVYPLLANTSDDVVTINQQFTAGTNLAIFAFYLNGHSMPITPVAMSNRNAQGTVYVAGLNSNPAPVCWDGTNTMTLPLQPGSTNLITATGVNAAMTTITTGTNNTPRTVAATQVVGNGSGYGYVWNMVPSTNSPPTFAPPQKLDTLVPGYGGTNAAWSGINAASLNDSGAVVGTGTYSGTNTAIPAGTHGVLLLPLQLKLLNGQTADFDGTIPTTWIPQSEFPEHDDLVTQTGITTLGPIAVGASGIGSLPFPGGIYYGLMVAAQAPASIPNMQFRWQRYYRERAWDLICNQTSGDWTVFNRDSDGTDPSEAPLGKSETVSYSDVNPSTGKHEFYAADTPGPRIPAGGTVLALDKKCHNGDFIVEIYSFTYKVQYSFDGLSWNDGQSLAINTYKILQFKQDYTGDAINDLRVITNSASLGPKDPTMTPSLAAYIVGSGHVSLDPNANINEP